MPFEDVFVADPELSGSAQVRPPVNLGIVATVVTLGAATMLAVGQLWIAYALAIVASILGVLALRVDAHRRNDRNYVSGAPIVAWMRVVRWIDLALVVLVSVLLAVDAAR